MSAFDPVVARQAVAEFIPKRPVKFQELLAAKDMIAELRQRRASFESIAELLTKHCLQTSKSAVALFCHQVLGEAVRPRRRPLRKRQSATEVVAPDESPAPTIQPADLESSVSAGVEPGQSNKPARGPRIAQIRILKTQAS